MSKLKLLLLLCVVIGLTAITGCSDDDDDNPGGNNGGGEKTAVLSGGTNNGDRTLSADTVYTLSGFYYVQPGTKLTIPAGTVIKGQPFSALITVRATDSKPSGQLICNGTQSSPVVFTSSQPEGSRGRSDWGGIVLTGVANLNLADGFGVGEGGTGAYGFGGVLSGPKNDDNSGVLNYVRIEYGGTKVTPDNEINGLTMNAVGTGTTIDYVQSHMIADDGFEWFGGTVTAKHLVSSGNDDDSFDMDFGFSGKLQFLFALQDPSVADKGFEIDNDGDGSDNTPYTSATIANVTLVGAGDKNDGMHLRRNNRLKIWNAIVTNFANAMVIDGENTGMNVQNGDLYVKNSIMHGVASSHITKGGAANYDGIYASWGNKDIDPQLASINFESPNPVPNANVSMPSPSSQDSFFSDAPYAGAFAPGQTPWIDGWTNFSKK